MRSRCGSGIYGSDLSTEILWNLPFLQGDSIGNIVGIIVFLRRHRVIVIFGRWYSLVNTPPVCRRSTEVTRSEAAVPRNPLAVQFGTART